MRFLFIIFCVLAPLSTFAAQNCTYEFDQESSVIEGTGYKFTEKKGVTAKFLQFSLNKTEKKKAIKDLLDGLVVTVDLMAIDSGNVLRDKNMREAFFSAIFGNAEVKVEVKKVKMKEIDAVLHLNEKSQPIVFTYSIDKKANTISAKSSFDVLKFSMDDAVKSLEKRCGSLHTGEDGKSKTWTTFDIAVKAAVKKVCK